MTLWFHPLCAAYKRPQPLLEALAASTEDVPDREILERAALRSVTHRRVPRVDGAERSPSGQARCRSCHEPIARGNCGYIHLTCRKVYFETDEVLDQLLHFTPDLSDAEREDLIRAVDTEPIDPSPQRT